MAECYHYLNNDTASERLFRLAYSFYRIVDDQPALLVSVSILTNLPQMPQVPGDAPSIPGVEDHILHISLIGKKVAW